MKPLLVFIDVIAGEANQILLLFMGLVCFPGKTQIFSLMESERCQYGFLLLHGTCLRTVNTSLVGFQFLSI